MSRILVQAPRQIRGDSLCALIGEGHDVVACEDREALFKALAERRPDVLVYVLGDVTTDVSVLLLLRRLAPSLPIILLGGPAPLAERRSIQELRPTYYGVLPLEPSELSDAVHGALNRVAGRG